MKSQRVYRCPACSGILDSRRVVARNLFDCPHCGETIRVKRWLRLTCAAIRIAVFVVIVVGATKLRVSHRPLWQVLVASFGVFVLFDEWESIVFRLFPPACLERVEPTVLTLGIGRAT
jgi:hypothetical protein